MTRRRPETSVPARRAILLAACLGAGLAGCAGGHRSGPATPAASVHEPAPALRRLRDLAQRPPSIAVNGIAPAPPPGLEPLAPTSADDPDAQTKRTASLADVLPRLVVPVQPPAPGRAPTADEATLALRLYASGRERLLRGDAAAALPGLKRATELDPSSGEPWLALGDAQTATGAHAESLASIEKAATLGASGARPWEALGRAALSARDPAKAAVCLARAALAQRSGDADPALGSLIGIELGQALDGLGYAQAAVESLAGALDLFDSVQGTQRYRSEIAAIARRRGDLWTRVGDLACRAGDYQRAAAAYDTAWALPTFASGRDALPARRVYAALQSGRSGAAAAAIFDSIIERGGWVGDDDLALCEYLQTSAGADAPQAPHALDAALQEFVRNKGPAVPPTLEGRLVLARAALHAPRQGAAILRDRLQRHPDDDPAALALLTLARAQSIRDAARTAIGLAARAPLRTETYARALLTMAPLHDLVAAARDPDAAAADLLAGRLLGLTDATDDSLARLDRAVTESKPGSAIQLGARLAIAEVAANGGRWDHVERALQELSNPWPALDQNEVLWARAGGLATAQRFGEAAQTLRRLADSAMTGDAPIGPRVERLLGAGEIASHQSSADDSERWISRAAALDPYDQRVYARQIGLDAPGGPKADQSKLADAVRRLRQNCPEGRMARALGAQDLFRRGSLEEARRQTLALARDDATDAAALDMLATICERLAGAGTSAGAPDTEAFLRDRVARAPDDAPAVAALSRVLAAGGHADQAESLLRSRLASTPQRDLSRALERLLRQSLARPDEADRLALERLGAATGSPPRPRSITEAVELAELLQHVGRSAEAAAALRDGIPAGAMLTPNQAQALTETAARATTDAGNTDNAPGLALLDIAADHGVHLPQELHARRLILLISDPLVPAERLLAAARQLESDYPDLAMRPYRFILDNLAAAETPAGSPDAHPRGRALKFAELAATSRPDPDILVEWARQIGVSGDAADARRMIEASLAAKVESEVVRRFGQANGQPSEPASAPLGGPLGAAELARLIGDLCSFEGREDSAADMYRLSLSYNPAHAWSANNLGYHIAETARRPDGMIDAAALDQSERLLAPAAAALPQEPSVLDSLGWVRYRRGFFRDRTDGNGNVVEGAVTLLTRAVGTPQGQTNQTILDHLGDALWLASEHDTAAGAWAMSEQTARQRLDALRAAGAPKRFLIEISDLLGQVSAKLAAVRAGMPPAVGWTIPTP